MGTVVRFWRDRRGTAPIDHALVVALVVAAHRIGEVYHHPMAAALHALFAAA